MADKSFRVLSLLGSVVVATAASAADTMVQPVDPAPIPIGRDVRTLPQADAVAH